MARQKSQTSPPDLQVDWIQGARPDGAARIRAAFRLVLDAASRSQPDQGKPEEPAKQGGAGGNK